MISSTYLHMLDGFYVPPVRLEVARAVAALLQRVGSCLLQVRLLLFVFGQRAAPPRQDRNGILVQ